MSPSLRYSALAGAVAGLSGIAVSHLLTNALNARATPVQAVAESVISLTPGPVAEALISVVGRKDKPILVAGVTLAVIGLGAVAGMLTRRSRTGAQLLLAAMGVLALLALMSGSDLTAAGLIPLAAGVATWFVVLAVLVDAVPPEPTQPPEPPGPAGAAGATVAGAGGAAAGEPSRRSFLLKAGGVTVAALVVAGGARLFGQGRRAVETARQLLRLPVSDGTVPAEATLELKGATPWRVPNADFYRIDTALVLPAVDPAEWRLRIHGMVERELVLTYDDLLARNLTEAWVTLCCVSNPVGGDLIGNAWWSGVRVADLLAEAGVSSDADAVLQTSQDDWTCGTPIEALTDGRDALLALAMNGEPLPIDHGFPVRMVVPGLYGFVSATKWLVDLEVTRFENFSAYWTERGWSARGPVKTQSRIEVPANGATVAAGPTRIGGHAWAQHTGIEKVEYRLDGAAWQRAELGGVPSLDTWVQWAATVELAPGEHTLAVRATDRSGYTQTSARTDVVPDGAAGWDSIDVTAQ
ncbi:molybdopterin-dependent oxidoreductase [Nocardioides mesophilus]|uniref:Molybdopterin-dependent oxidoreductase n=1 Tax=Nocardioides mesophilus TaxID=433659 RepID=A0A7G9RGY3_9ACTN|nr:molybdopterin-dependent oxidoreductase [Nocardioides mesophilus]